MAVFFIPPAPSLLMSIFATVFSHLFYQLCYSPIPPPPLPPSPPAFFCSDRSHYKQTRLILCLQLSAVSVIVSSPAPTLLRGKCVVIYCFITLALMGGNILHPPPSWRSSAHLFGHSPRLVGAGVVVFLGIFFTTHPIFR